MATTNGGYNPVGYHVGTVWPHDNSFIAWGLNRAGYRKEAARIALGMLEAATYFGGRLPEVFAGYPRVLTHYPVEYPTACSPQAWATGAPLLLLRTLLGLEPIGNQLLVDPGVPRSIKRLELFEIPGRWGQVDALGRGHLDVASASGRTLPSEAAASTLSAAPS
jgi:glycogen debranching enzyme